MSALKKRFLKLLEEDVEFKYTVAGYLGLSEVLKRLDSLSNEQVNLRNELVNLRNEQIKLSNELVKLRKEQIKLRREQIRLRRDFNEMLKVVKAMDIRLSRVEKTLEKLTVDVEDEARSILKHRLRKEFSLDMEVGSLSLPELELNIYGVSGEVCVVGEATVRGGAGIIDELTRKINILKSKYPEKLRKNIVPVVYVCLPLEELVEEARKREIWVLKAVQDFHKPISLNQKLQAKQLHQ